MDKTLEQRIAAYAIQLVDAAPPLTDEQKARLRELLRPVAVAPERNAEEFAA